MSVSVINDRALNIREARVAVTVLMVSTGQATHSSPALAACKQKIHPPEGRFSITLLETSVDFPPGSIYI